MRLIEPMKKAGIGDVLGGAASGGLTLGALGAGAGALYGTMHPGEDEEGNQRTRGAGALRGAGTGALVGAGMGVPLGAVGGSLRAHRYDHIFDDLKLPQIDIAAGIARHRASMDDAIANATEVHVDPTPAWNTAQLQLIEPMKDASAKGNKNILDPKFTGATGMASTPPSPKDKDKTFKGEVGEDKTACATCKKTPCTCKEKSACVKCKGAPCTCKPAPKMAVYMARDKGVEIPKFAALKHAGGMARQGEFNPARDGGTFNPQLRS